ncbi:MAG: hypothetical protein LBL64_02015 [Treponema sp.]|jgi:hypothetical protein|nr:hypothetical protein [Treponema sp.]
MKKYPFFAVPSLVLLLAACNIGNNDNGGTPSRDFWAVDNVKGTYYSLTADCLAENDYCMVYADQKANVDSGVAQNIADVYESKIHGPITGTFGTIMDVDENGKVIFLLLDILDGSTGGGYIAGYFYSLDMMKKSEDPKAQAYYSNEADMLYIDTKPGLQSMSSLYSTMAHELQHLINYSNTAAKDGREPDVWINEGLSTAAEFIYGRNLSRPNDIYLSGSSIIGDPNGRLIVYSDPQDKGYNKNIRCGNNFYIWSGFWEENEAYGDLGNYATVYLFFQWLRAHASNGTVIYKEIINSPYRDYRAVTTSVKTRFGDKISLPGSGDTEADWDIVLRSWFLANLLKQGGRGIYGYNGCLDYSLLLTPFIRPGDYPGLIVGVGDGEWYFSPGEGIYSQLHASGDVTHTFANGGTHIQYVGIQSDHTLKVVDNDFDVEAQYLLTYNKNTLQDPEAEETGDINRLASAGFLANRLFNEGGGSASWGYLPGNYPVDRDTMARLREGKKPEGRLNKRGR